MLLPKGMVLADVVLRSPGLWDLSALLVHAVGDAAPKHLCGVGHELVAQENLAGQSMASCV